MCRPLCCGVVGFPWQLRAIVWRLTSMDDASPGVATRCPLAHSNHYSLKYPLLYLRKVLCRWIQSRLGGFHFVCRAGSWATETPLNATCRQWLLASPSMFALTMLYSWVEAIVVRGFEVESEGGDLLGVQGEGGGCSCWEISHRDHHCREDVSLIRIRPPETTSLYPNPDAVQPRSFSAVSEF